MNDAPSRIPYSRKGLENLAAALNINSGSLWINPGTGALSLRDGYRTASSSLTRPGKIEVELEEEQE
jgi:hypothetical protein